MKSLWSSDYSNCLFPYLWIFLFTINHSVEARKLLNDDFVFYSIHKAFFYSKRKFFRLNPGEKSIVNFSQVFHFSSLFFTTGKILTIIQFLTEKAKKIVFNSVFGQVFPSRNGNEKAVEMMTFPAKRFSRGKTGGKKVESSRFLWIQ